MKRVALLNLLLLAGAVVVTSCKKDEKEKEKEKYTNSYAVNGGAETPIEWAAFRINTSYLDQYEIGLCKRVPPAGKFWDGSKYESEGIEFGFLPEKLNQKITIGGPATADWEWWVCLTYDDVQYWENSLLHNGADKITGWYQVSRTGTSNVFTIKFDLTFGGKHIVGNYQGNLIEKNEYFGFD